MATNINISMRYSTFMPMLIEAMRRTNGDTLELGAGVFSTPLLHWLCERAKRKLLTIESDRGWFKFTRQYLQNDQHNFIYVSNWDDAEKYINKNWDVVLIDHSPSERRVVEIRKLANLAKYLVLHDTEPWKDREYRYSTIYPLFRYRFDFNIVDHQTTVVSNFFRVDDFWSLK
jgi:hypothetical protein